MLVSSSCSAQWDLMCSEFHIHASMYEKCRFSDCIPGGAVEPDLCTSFKGSPNNHQRVLVFLSMLRAPKWPFALFSYKSLTQIYTISPLAILSYNALFCSKQMKHYFNSWHLMFERRVCFEKVAFRYLFFVFLFLYKLSRTN